ncbi:MAG: UvrD-helicase domain-containing protein [Clostridia bacterium]|nr:UvrD-helicase domain-containing protein [Clostridia bacterium]
MARNWTPAQTAAMNTRGKTLLVSAAAGSGKTATLTERIIRRITDKDSPADIAQMLIVTFTRSAAAELRARIFAALGDALADDPTSKHLASQLMKIGSAKICTIDSFYLDVIRSNFSTLGLSAKFRLADDSEYTLMARKAMDESIDRMYATEKDFPAFCECFGTVKTSSRVTDVMLDIYDKLTSIPEGIEYVAACARKTETNAEIDFMSTPYGEIVKASTIDILEYYKEIFSSALEYMEGDEHMRNAYGASFAYDHAYITSLLDVLRGPEASYEGTQNLLLSYSPVSLSNLSSKNKTDEAKRYQTLRTEFNTKRKTLIASTYSKPQSLITRAMKDTSKMLGILYRLLSDFEARIDEAKARISVMTFSDVRRYTLKLLVNAEGNPTEIARRYAEQYTDIYIDEYQDVDRVQDAIFKSIARAGNRFMVGDIKQSIYGFRGAEPMLFAEYRRDFPPLQSADNSDTATIFMSDNFRCDKNVIDFTNAVCSTVFSACADSIGYTPEDDLRYSKIPPSEDYISPKVKIALITPPEDIAEDEELETDADARKLWDARYIASEIKRLMREEKKADGSPITPGDVAILFRAKSMIPAITAELERAGLLYSLADGERYFENPDVLMVLCILNTIDNPERDIYLAGTLRSPIFNFTMDDLVALRRYVKSNYSLFGALCEYAKNEDDELSEKSREFISVLESWQSEATSLPVDRFLRMLFYSERFIASGLVSQTDSRGEGGNLLILYEYARKFENGSFKGLYQFVEYINSVIRDGGKLASENKGGASDRVSVMTIHKSKGLEFPVCFICNTTGSIRPQEISNSMVFEYSSGIALKVADGSGFARINTPMRDAVISKIYTKQIEEEMRILYVALTRARERLYLSGTTAYTLDKLSDKAEANARLLNRYTILNKCSSYLDWTLTALAARDEDSYELECIPLDRIADIGAPALEACDEENVEIDEALVNTLRKQFDFKYEYSVLSRVPSKLSVSRLYPDVLDENDESLELFATEQKASVPDFFLSGAPSGASSAERGTATHLFLQFCDYKNARAKGASEELARLAELKFIPESTKELVYLSELEKFLHSELIELIIGSKQVIREQRFNVELPVDKFSSDPELLEKMRGETLAVQGVIDLLLIDEDGEISLYDYKTDRLMREERENYALAAKRMNETHGLQLSYYAKAIELLYGKPCRRICVYSTHSATLYDIDVKL